METRWVNGREIIVHPNFRHTLPAERLAPPARWQSLPADVLHRVAALLPCAKDLCSFERICRSSRRAADDDLLWRELCLRSFNSPRHELMRVTWRALYKYNHQVLYDVLLMRRPTKALDLGNGFILLNPIVMA